MAGGIWGQTRDLDNRALGPADLTQRRSDGRGGLGAQIWGQARCPIYRSGTFNVKRSTHNLQRCERKGRMVAGIWGQTRCLETGGVNRGTGTMSGMDQIWGQTRNSTDRIFDPLDLSKRRSGGRGRLERPDMGTDTMSDVPNRNVQRETFNSQLSMGGSKGRMVAGIWGQTRSLEAGGANRGTGTMSGMDQIWRQTRNSADRIFDPLDLSKRRSGGRGRLERPDMGTDTMSDVPNRNVQRETFNSQPSTV